MSLQIFANDILIFDKFKNKKHHWKKANGIYFNAAHFEERDKLEYLKSRVSIICKKEDCRFVYSHFFSYLFYKDYLKKLNKKNYLEVINSLSKQQSKMIYKCKKDLVCEIKVVESFCGMQDKIGFISYPFCLSNFYLSKI